MTDHPMLFSGPMVRAIIEGQKTQTRRVLQVPDKYNFLGIYGPGLTAVFENAADFYVDWKQRLPSLGERLWVRETFNDNWGDDVIYRADGGSAIDAGYKSEPKWKPSIHMPKKYCRLWLRVTDVRVQRLQDISHDDAVAEGAGMYPICMSAQKRFRETIWDSLYAKRGYGWDENPWVVAITFEKIDE